MFRESRPMSFCPLLYNLRALINIVFSIDGVRKLLDVVIVDHIWLDLVLWVVNFHGVAVTIVV